MNKFLLLLTGFLFFAYQPLFAQNYNMSTTTVNTCSGTFYDPGGTGNYANNQNTTMTFCSNSGQPIFFTFSNFQLENFFDNLVIYNGPNTASPLLGSYTGTNSPGTIQSTNPSNCLTFVFTSDGSVTLSGWVAAIGCGTPPPPPPSPLSIDCSTTITPLCGPTSYPAPPNQPNFGSVNCLGAIYNPNWYYVQIQNSGSQTWTISSSCDVDFALWGPFTTFQNGCTFIPTNLVDCSFSTSNVEYADIPASAVSGQFYILLVSNFCNVNTTVSISQTGGSGSPAPCNTCNLTASNTPTAVTCAGGNNGSATVTTGGTTPGPYTYSWVPNVGNTATVSNLTAGNYTCYVSVTANPACSTSTSVTINTLANTPPAINGCPANSSLPNDPGACGAIINWTTPTVTDNCPNATLVQTAGPSSGTLFPLGTTMVSYLATDASGLTATCNFNITVSDTEPPAISGCPANFNVVNDPGVCGALINWVTPVASDNCQGVVFTQTAGPASGSVFPIGTTLVSYLATDAVGLTSGCSFNVTVTDSENPVITGCPANINIPNDLGVCGALINWTAPAATDNCPGLNFVQTSGPASGTVFPIGTTTVSYLATDAAGLTAICTFDVTITDSELPVIAGCPTSIVIANDPGVCGAVVNYGTPAFSDNCPGATMIMDFGIADGGTFPIGTTPVSYTVTDASGNTANCSFTVTVNDTELPVIQNCPAANINVSNDNGVCGAVINWIPVTASDNCSFTFGQTLGLPSGSVFPIGTTQIEFTATDSSGNTVTCNFDVTVNDTENPVIANCPANITVNNDPGVCGAIITWPALTVSDNCPNATIIQSAGLISGSLFPIGTTNIQYIATDSVGNTDTCSFTVTVNDAENPTMICQNLTVYLDGTGNASVTLPMIDGGTTDNCGISSLTLSNTTFNCTNAGPNNVTLTATDVNGNIDSCITVVTVSDSTPPVAACQNITVYLDPGGNVSITTNQIDSGSNDNCGIASTTIDVSSFTCADAGPNPVVLTVTDVNGNISTCTSTVTVQDSIPPTAICQNISIQLDASGSASITAAQIDNGSFDNCGIASVTVSPSTFNCTTPGANNVVLTVTDVNGNISTCNAVVTLNDSVPPVFSGCPANISQNNDSGQCGAIVSWTAPTVNDNCSAIVNASHTPGSFFPTGATVVTYIATDPGGNQDTCTFTVTVTDNENPVIANCPANISVNAGANCAAIVNWTAPTATDNCPGVALASTHNPGTSFALGSTVVTYTATDALGFTSTCSFTVTVTDNTPPVINNCPANIAQNAGPNCDAIVNWIAPTVSDNCAGATLSTAIAPGSTFPLGTTTVTYLATDAAGNTANCIFTVTISDATPPVISNCPSNMVINLGAGCDTTVSWTAPTAADNCGIPAFVSSHTPGSVFPLGTTNVTYTATDAAGLISVCTFSITINPPSPLVAAISQINQPLCAGLPGSASVSVSGGSGSYSYSWNSTPAQFTDSATLNSGNYTVFIADALAIGCVTSQSLPVMIVAPAVLAENTIITPLNCFGDANGSAVVNISGGTMPYTYTWSNNPGMNVNAMMNLGAGNYTVTVNDANNCQIIKSFTLAEPDSLRAISSQVNVKCFGEATGQAKVVISGGTAPYSYNWTGSASATNTASGLTAGNYSVTVTDANGCTISRNFALTQPASPLNIQTSHTDLLCFDDDSGTAGVIANGGTPGYTYTWNTIPRQYTPTATGMSTGTYLITVRDANGCTQTATESIVQPQKLKMALDWVVNAYCDLPNGKAAVKASGGTMPYTISWNTTPVQTGPEISDVAAGTYTAFLTDANGCQVSFDVDINNRPPATALFNSNPTNADSIVLNNATIAFENLTQGGSGYSWNFGDGSISNKENPTHTFQTHGTYTVSLTAYNGFTDCPDTYSLTYHIIPNGVVYFPNAFSPNGDMVNDLFYVSGQGITQMECLIYSRWGTLVAALTSPSDTWNGKDKSGRDLPEGTYVYKFRCTMNDGRGFERGGSVIIIR